MATASSAFPRLNPRGTHVVAGERVIVVDRVMEVGPGTSAQWADEGQLFYTRQPDGAFMEWQPGELPTVIRDGFNAFSVGGRNRWAGYSAARGVVEFDNGTVVPGWSGPALSDDPSVWAAVIHESGEIVTSHGRPQRFADRDCRDLRWCGRALVWNVYVLGRWQVAGCREIGGIVDLLNVEPEEFWPVPLLVNGALWLMTHSHNRLLLRPWGSRDGYIVATGITNTPDVKQMPNGRVRVVWDAGQNVLEDISLDPQTRPMVSLELPSTQTPVLDTTSVVDVFDYVPLGLALDGSHLMAYRLTGQQPGVFSIAKHEDGGGEWWAYDDQWVYHHFDQGGSPIEDVISGQFGVRRDAQGNRIDAYYFAPDARWMPRRVKTGDEIEVETRIHRIADGSSEPWRMVNAFDVFSSFPTPFGSGPAMRITYDPRTAIDPETGRKRGRYEKGVYVVVNGRHYHRWEDWRTKDDNSGDELMQQTEFTQMDVAPVVNWRPSRRPANAPLLPVEDDMNAPGVTVDRYGPVIGPTGTWSVEFHDRNNEGISGKVEIVNGSVHVTMTNPEGSDRSGNKRQVEIRSV